MCVAFAWPPGRLGASREVVTTTELGTPKWYPKVRPAWLEKGGDGLRMTCVLGEREHPSVGLGLPRLGTLGLLLVSDGRAALRVLRPKSSLRTPLGLVGSRVRARQWALGCRTKAQPSLSAPVLLFRRPSGGLSSQLSRVSPLPHCVSTRMLGRGPSGKDVLVPVGVSCLVLGSHGKGREGFCEN